MKLKTQLCVLILFIVFAIVMFELTEYEETNIIIEETGSILVMFCDIENCSDALNTLIISSNKSNCAFYNQMDENLKNKFKKINSTTLIYSKNYKDFGKPIYTNGLMHHKIHL